MIRTVSVKSQNHKSVRYTSRLYPIVSLIMLGYTIYWDLKFSYNGIPYTSDNMCFTNSSRDSMT